MDERLELAMTARTYGELAKLVADLPAAGSVASSPAPRAKDIVRLDCGSGHTVRNGRWVVPQRMEARVRSGHMAPFPGEDQAAAVAGLVAAGAVRADIGQGDVSWTVLADPEGSEFCVLSPQ